MLLASHLAILAGVIISSILIFVSFLFFFPNLFSDMHTDRIVADAPAQVEADKPSGLMMMVMAVNILGNFSAGSFISVVTTYAGKRDQTKDRPAPLETNISRESNR